MVVVSPVNGQEIDVNSLVDAVRVLASESPTNIYMPAVRGEKCHYSSGDCKNGSRGCIVGQALARIGLNPADFETCDGVAPSAAKVVGDLSGEWGAAAWLRCVQSHQDAGKSWIASIRYADEQGSYREV